MPKNKGKGGKNRKRGPNKINEPDQQELLFKEDGQEYARVIKMLGDCRVEAQCFDHKQRQCHIRGKMKKRNWIMVGDTILIGLREYQDSKADVIHKYTEEETRNLKIYGELPDEAQGTNESELKDEIEIEFREVPNDLYMETKTSLDIYSPEKLAEQPETSKNPNQETESK